MRFARDLHKHQVPEWTSSYVHYAALKKLYKFTVKATVEGQSQAAGLWQELSTALQLDIIQVEAFYLHQYASLKQRAAVLCNLYGKPADFSSLASFAIHDLCQQEVEEVVAACLELRLGLKKLQWYGKVNRDGFSRLLDKLKRFPDTTFDDLQLCQNEFAGQCRSIESLDQIDKAVINLSSAKSTSSTSLFLESFCARFHPANGFAANLHRLVAQDEASGMNQMLQALHQDPLSKIHLQALRQVLLQRTVMCGSRKCMHELILQLESIQNDSFMAQDTCLHRIIISMGQNALQNKWRNQMCLEDSENASKIGAENALSLFTDLLDHLLPNQHPALLQEDVFGRIPLHYASQYGLVNACQILLQRMQNWKTVGGITLAHTVLLPDAESYTPLHLAVINGHTGILRTLLEFLQREHVATESINEIDLCTTLVTLIDIALRSNFVEIVKLLLTTRKLNLNYRNQNGETALFVAARSGRPELVKILLESPSMHELDLNLLETAYNWSPLIIACVQGHLPVVTCLLEAGADQSVCDVFGWTARDHTALRCFWPIAKLLTAPTSKYSARIPKIQLPKTNSLPPCSADETRIFVNLGTLNTREPKAAVDMNLYFSKYPYNPYPETGISIKITAIGANGSTALINLPILNDATNYPHLFTTTDLKSVQLVFSVFKSAVNSREEIEHIGGAVALLASLKEGLGVTRESLIRNYTIPILEKDSLGPIGTITFDFLAVSPFPQQSTNTVSPSEFWNRSGQTQVIGHRGFGQNHPAFERLQIGENTIQSFLSTMNVGVSYIECDVQLTRDHIPIIYHDFLVSESGADLAPHNLSLDQFMHISDAQTTRVSAVLTESIELSPLASEKSRIPRSRSRSLDLATDLRSRCLLERMKHTYEFKLKGFKGNIRGEHIHGSFTTLEELLRTLPEHLGMDIELKYPMLWEAEDWKMDTYGVELNTFVDAILSKVYTLGGRRKIIFTSFSPELCILLSHKQQQYPVLFLNESNLFPTGDVRASDLQEAVHFARRWNLLGVVMSSEPFIMSSNLITYVKDAGLKCVSFGFLNNNAENAKIQFEANIDAIIVDDVNLISKSLRSTTI